VRLRTRLFAAAVVGFCLGHLAPGQEPSPLPVGPASALPANQPSVNQRVADTIANHLRSSGQIQNYTVDVYYHDGVATLIGQVTDQPQREEVLRIVQGVPGIERVVDRLRLTPAMGVIPAQAETPVNPPPPTANPGPAPTDSLPLTPPPEAAGPPGIAEPTPIFAAPAPGPLTAVPPKMPPYAWPTYAPYNNYSRVAYPLAYPYNAFPFIGPCYPFPKVPLGWRSVKLEWEDGHWWFRKTANAHDWWHLRYW
jgi:hypothetical protein